MWEENWTMRSHLMILEIKVRYFFHAQEAATLNHHGEKGNKTDLGVKGCVYVDLGKLSNRVEGVILVEKKTIKKPANIKTLKKDYIEKLNFCIFLTS